MPIIVCEIIHYYIYSIRLSLKYKELLHAYICYAGSIFRLYMYSHYVYLRFPVNFPLHVCMTFVVPYTYYIALDIYDTASTPSFRKRSRIAIKPKTSWKRKLTHIIAILPLLHNFPIYNILQLETQYTVYLDYIVFTYTLVNLI